MTVRRLTPALALLLLLCGSPVLRADDTPAAPPPPPPPATPSPSGAQPSPAQPSPAPASPTPAASASTAPTVIAGRVTDVLGKPIAGARVYVMPRGGGRMLTVTDKDGRYNMLLADESGAYSIVIAVSRINTYRQVLVNAHASTTLDVEVETDIGGGEVIQIIDRKMPAPAVPPAPSNNNDRKSLPYSPQAMERDAWARAFLLLDIDATGTVTRLKLLKRPGFDLDQIAIDEAFKLKFDPARDAKGHPIQTYIVWDMEWPSWGWLVQGNGTAAGRPSVYNEIYKDGRLDPGVLRTGPPSVHVDQLGDPVPGEATTARGGGSVSGGNDPGDRIGDHAPALATSPFTSPAPMTPQMPLSRVPCAGSGPLNLDLQNRAYRDCSRPDLTMIDALPWITRANAKTALAAIDSNKPQVIPGPRRSRVPAWIATGVSGALLVGMIASYVEYDKYSSMKFDQTLGNKELVEARERAVERVGVWNHRMLGFAGATVVSGAVTAFLWGRSQTRESFSVQPSKRGATLSYGRSF